MAIEGHNKPNFIIVGTMKSGTNTLGRYLEQHDEVFIAPREIHFFSNEDNFEKGSEWYASHFEEATANQITGERCPPYASYSAAPKRIHALNPDVKLIWIFRNPIERAYSHYWHFANRGGEKNRFAEAIKEEANWPEWRKERGYLFRSRYVEQVNKYLQYFSKEHMLFLTFEALKQDFEHTVKQVFAFLKVDTSAAISSRKIVSHKTFIPRNVAVNYYLQNWIGKHSPRGRYYINKLIMKAHAGYPPMDKQTEQELQAYFAPYNAELAHLTGLDLSVWDPQLANIERQRI